MSQLQETPQEMFATPDAANVLREVLAGLYAPIQTQLAEAEKLLNDQLQSKHPSVDTIIRHGVRLGGKRMRPALLLLAGQAAGSLGKEHATLAAVVEMIHLATLVHDDVLDEAAIRRHVDTVNARWDNETSVLLGDFLFTHAFYLASTTGSTYACETIGRSTNIVCEGELRQTTAAGDLELSEADYLSMIESKTAELCACCCHLGAHYAGANPDIVKALTEFGRNLGIAFQIIDDMLDLEGQEDQTGKSLGSDLAKCKLTLPLIHARDNSHNNSHGNDQSRGQLENLMQLLAEANDHSKTNITQSIDLAPSLNYAKGRAHEFVNLALDCLEIVPPSPAKESLSAMAHFTLARSG